MGSIRYYIFTRFFSLIILQVFVIFGLVWFYLGQEYFQDIINTNYRQLKSVSQSIQYFYTHQADELTRLGKKNGFSPYNRDKAQQLINAYIQTRELISSVHYYNKKGQLEFVSTLDKLEKYDPSKNIKDHASQILKKSFNKILIDKKRYFSPPIYTKSGSFYHVGMIPIFANGTFHGVLSFAFFPHINPFNQSLEGLVADSQNFLSITDEKGNIVAKQNIRTKHLAPVLVEYIKNRGVNPTTPFKYAKKSLEQLKYKIGDETYYIISRRVKKLPFFIVLGVNEKILLNRRSKYIDICIIVISISALIGILASFLISSKLSEGISVLVSSIKKLKKGSFKKQKNLKLHEDFLNALDEIEDLSIEIKKGKIMGNFWGQGDLLKDDQSSK